jgi:hypothetical protein
MSPLIMTELDINPSRIFKLYKNSRWLEDMDRRTTLKSSKI